MNKIKMNDEVIILAGKDKGKKGKVKKINWLTNRVVVEGINMVKKNLKPTQQNPNGGVVDMEASLNISNISCISPKTGKATRVAIMEKSGKKVRVAKACGSVLA